MIAALLSAVLLAASSGLAWDSVTKLSMADAATLQPGSFDEDYAQAAAVQPPSESSSNGMFAKMNQAVAMAKHLQAVMQNGFAERHYVAGPKERIDQVAEQIATITDCAARTVTTLDLRKKTYRVVSMDQASPASPGSSAPAAPQPGAASDKTRVAIVIANTALDSRTIGGQPTTGFASEMSFTVTQPSGQSQSYNGDIRAYYAAMTNPTPSCALFRIGPVNARSSSNATTMFGAMGGAYARLMNALSHPGTDSRLSLKQSGPAVPRGKFAMYQAVTIGGGREGGGTIVTERGNVHPIDANDPVFSVPSDFTRAQ